MKFVFLEVRTEVLCATQMNVTLQMVNTVSIALVAVVVRVIFFAVAVHVLTFLNKTASSGYGVISFS
jgi:hypothetical protein